MEYEAKNFRYLQGIEGLSDELLNNHFTLYEGYVKNTNQMLELFNSKEPGTVEYAEAKRRFGWEWDGMRMHELFFGNLSKDKKELGESELKKEIERVFGDFEKWKENFAGVGAMRGIGWVVLYYDKAANELFNVWINEHDQGHLMGAEPLLILDVFEHAYMIDYGTKKTDYIKAILENIDWEVVSNRFDAVKK